MPVVDLVAGMGLVRYTKAAIREGACLQVFGAAAHILLDFLRQGTAFC